MFLLALVVILAGGPEVSLKGFPEIKSVVWQNQKNAIAVYIKEDHDFPDNVGLIGCYLQAAKQEPRITFPFTLSFFEYDRQGDYLLPRRTFSLEIDRGDCENEKMEEKIKQKALR